MHRIVMRLARFITSISAFIALASLAVLGASSSDDANAKGLYSQIVLTLGTPRPMQQDYDKADNALVIALQRASPASSARWIGTTSV